MSEPDTMPAEPHSAAHPQLSPKSDWIAAREFLPEDLKYPTAFLLDLPEEMREIRRTEPRPTLYVAPEAQSFLGAHLRREQSATTT